MTLAALLNLLCNFKSLLLYRFSYSISSVHSLSHAQLFVTPQTAVRQASLSITKSWSLLKLMSIGLVMPSNSLILCCPLLLLPSIFPSIRVFSKESVLCIRSFCLFILFMGFSRQDTEVVCHFLLQWTTSCQNSPPRPVHLRWPYMAWVIVSLRSLRWRLLAVAYYRGLWVLYFLKHTNIWE